jgi:hypothetical protein
MKMEKDAMTRKELARIALFILLISIAGCADNEQEPSPAQPPTLMKPVLVAPADAAALLPLRPSLRWHPSQGATSYEVQVAQTLSFENPVGEASSWADTSASVGPLLPGTAYFWHVRAGRQAATGDWSATWIFTTAGNWEFAPSTRFAVALYTDAATYITGDSLDIKVVAYNLHEVFGAAFQLNYPHDLLGVGRVVYNPALFTDPDSYLVVHEIEPDSNRASIGFTFLRNSGRSFSESAVLLRLRCRALAAGSANLSIETGSLMITKPNGDPIDSLGNLEMEPLSLTFGAR